jgi:hypothetical protein
VWQGDGGVRVALTAVFPPGCGYKQTVDGRRRRCLAALPGVLAASGWQDVVRLRDEIQNVIHEHRPEARPERIIIQRTRPPEMPAAASLPQTGARCTGYALLK